jgi:hypothetical protein
VVARSPFVDDRTRGREAGEPYRDRQQDDGEGASRSEHVDRGRTPRAEAEVVGDVAEVRTGEGDEDGH